MAFLERQFPSKIDYSSSGGPEFKTDIVEMEGGHEHRNQIWVDAKHDFVINRLNIASEIDDLTDLFMEARGRLRGFRIKDWRDYRTGSNFTPPTAIDHILLGSVDGINKDFQLVKRYGTTVEYVRWIQKPVSGTVVISIDDIPQGAGWTVDTTTGIVTFTIAPTGGEVIKGGCEFDVPVRFDTDRLDGTHEFLNAETFSLPIVEIKDIV